MQLLVKIPVTKPANISTQNITNAINQDLCLNFIGGPPSWSDGNQRGETDALKTVRLGVNNQ